MCNITGRLSAHAEYPHVNARLDSFVFLTVLQTMKLRGMVGTDVWQPCSVL